MEHTHPPHWFVRRLTGWGPKPVFQVCYDPGGGAADIVHFINGPRGKAIRWMKDAIRTVIKRERDRARRALKKGGN